MYLCDHIIRKTNDRILTKANVLYHVLQALCLSGLIFYIYSTTYLKGFSGFGKTFFAKNTLYL